MKQNGWRIGALVVCLVLLCCACAPRGVDTDTTTVPTTVPTTTRPTGTPTTVVAFADAGLQLSSPTGEKPQAETLERIASICKRYKGTVSLYYKDLENGYTLTYDADSTYQAASVIKAPYVKYLLESGVDQREQLTLKVKKGGSTHIDAQPIGTKFTVGELMEYAIRYSDNSAYNLLNERFGFKEFTAHADQLGIQANRNNDLTLLNPKPQFGYLCAQDIGLYFEDIAKFVETGTPEAKQLFSWLVTTTETRQFTEAYSGRKQYFTEQPKGGNNVVLLETAEQLDAAYAARKEGYTIGHKYGEQGAQAYHDGAVVWRDHPYVIAITSTLTPNDENSIKVFHDLALLIDQMQTEWYSR